MSLKPVLARLAAGERLAESEAEHAFDLIMAGEATPAQIAGLLMAMRVRGETVAEMTGAVRAMRARMVAIEAPPEAIDIVGTGGDSAGTFNISTAAALVVAACGVPVAKHGNRALSSRSGAADALAALGVTLDVPFERLPGVLAEAGICFLMAPRHHAALRHAAGPRVELGTRTIFNLLGPLANPARVRRQMTGAFSPQWLRPMAEALARLAEVAQAEELYWKQEIDRLEACQLRREGEAVLVRCSGLQGLPLATARRLVRRAIELASGSLRRIEFEHVEGVIRLASSRQGTGRLALPGLRAERSFDWLRLSPAGAPPLSGFEIPLQAPARVAVPGRPFGLSLDIVHWDKGFPRR